VRDHPLFIICKFTICRKKRAREANTRAQAAALGKALLFALESP
jgi:hypothetical protein